MYTYTSQHMRLVVELHTKPLTVTGTHRSTRAINCMNWDPLLINDLSVAISLGACEYSWHDGSEQPRFRRGTLASFAGWPPPALTHAFGDVLFALGTFMGLLTFGERARIIDPRSCGHVSVSWY